ncbi:hypothetical protein HYN56_11055 [Flavobacterium crocinum]|uniref:Tail fiber protein n=1 Tax=Flavobacterium crocinum TaxID=2183896 RepID=A0A2S1YL09_9FLAO|nr:hypothetical protein [Flavobacterium crocinum]AWK04732.1 hypothetical protein HYN56_11055 [Flavobacterium crocinum]
MATDRTNIGYKFENGDIPSQGDFQEVFNSFIHKDEDKADFQMVEVGSDNQHYVTPALLYTGLKNIGIITGNNYVPYKEQFDNFIGNSLPLKYPPVRYSVKAFKNGQLLFEREGEGNEGDYIINYDNAVITFSSDIDKRNIEVAYWYKNLSPNTGGGSGGQQIDFTNFLHTSGNETKNGILTFNNTTPTPTSGIVLTNSGADAGAKVLDVTVSGAGSGVSVQNTATGTGIKLSNSGAGTGVELNSTATATGDPLKVTKDNVVKAKIDSEGIVSAEKFVSARGQRTEFVKGDGFLDPTTYAEDNKVIHIEGNEERDGALKLTHDDSVEDVLTIEKNNSANCLKLIQNSTSNATTSTFYTNSPNVNRKAISIQKGENENAFITHDGNLSGTSFTTLNEKADITDGFLTLAASTSTTPTAGHAKLYAKTAGTTDLYVMGSDGVEKKIGGTVDLSGKENTIVPGTEAQYYRGDKSWQTLDKTAVGLTNVDNTSDLNKPVSTATQTALDLKASLASPPLTGIPTAPTAAAGTNTTQIATTAFVLANADQTPDATTTIKGKIKLAGDLGGTADLPTTPTAVHKTGLEQIRGLKLFQNPTTVDAAGISMSYNTSGPNGLSLYTVNNSAANTGVVFENKGSAGSSSFLVELGTSNSGAEGITINTRASSLPNAYAIRIFQATNRSDTKFSVRDTGDTTANSFIKIGGTNLQYLMADGSTAAVEPMQITITTAVSITTDTLDANSKKQLGKNVIISNGTSAINIIVNGGTDFNASYLKHGTGAITFVQASGRTLVQVNATATLNGAAGSTATISSIGTTDYLRISNV